MKIRTPRRYHPQRARHPGLLKFGLIAYVVITGIVGEMAAYGRGVGDQNFLGTIVADGFSSRGVNNNPWVDASTFNGVDRTGATDSTAGLQAAVNFCSGTGDATAVTRTARANLWIPPGSYVTSVPISVVSVAGLVIQGAGPRVTRFLPAATLDSVWDLNGLQTCYLGGWSYHGDSQAGTKVDKLTFLYWTTATSHTASNMVTFNSIENVDAVFTTACFRTTIASNTNEVDNIAFFNCIARGAWAQAGSDSQSGFHFGSGTPANALAHFLYHCQAYKVRYGLQSQGVSFGVWGGQMAMGASSMDRAFYVSASPKWGLIEGFRSESAQRLIEVLGFSTSTDITIRNVEYQADQLNADTRFINILSGGSYLIENVQCLGADGGTVRLAPGNAGWQLNVTINGLTIRNTAPLSQIVFAGSGTVNLFATGLQQCDSSNSVTVGLEGTLRGTGVTPTLVRDLSGTGSPETVYTASVGSTYHRTDGGAGTSLYVKESGAAATGWIAK